MLAAAASAASQSKPKPFKPPAPALAATELKNWTSETSAMEDKSKTASAGTVSVPTTSASTATAAQASAKQVEECQPGQEKKETTVETDSSKEPLTKPLANKEDVTNSKDPPNDAASKEVGSEKVMFNFD